MNDQTAGASELSRRTAELAFGRGSVLGWARACTPYERLLSHISYEIDPALHLNACAVMLPSGERHIRLNAGCMRELDELICSALRWKELREFLHASQLGLERTAALVLGACLDFIVWHEIQHHGLGHIGYFHRDGDPGLFERSPEGGTVFPAKQPMTPLDCRACELSADGQAMSFIWRHQNQLRADPACRYYGLGRNQFLRLVSFAGFLALACIATGEPSLDHYDRGLGGDGMPSVDVDVRRSRYPHPSLRAMHVDAQLERQHRLWWLFGDRRTTKAALGAAVSLAKSQEYSFDLFMPILHEPDYLRASHASIMRHWASIQRSVEAQGLWERERAYE